MKSKYPAKLTGAINWVLYDNDSGSVDVKRALLRSANEIIIDCESDGCSYTIQLFRSGNDRFEGKFMRSPQSTEGKATCELYSNVDAYFFFGSWLEDGSDYHWWARLKQVGSFPDEQNVTKDG